ncbi:pimeloyl-ACP methyl esterase BioG family protein [Thermodesulfatator autotrophicus]|uniref:Uncharacterized protein n=1 Tax=Thermodesulfatator autotrophicus TaxID=1795632 RepID=A0A177E5H1_9BACT|nr:pimeloyl-ACP methyl esterase BioG family protein [Thermodesulfatator autotrophicus]OAG27145.1 hypothetical protein TH606_08535 [Thermodesulfatator autotrophicus]
MKFRFIKRKGEGLLIFFLGWSLDERPFLPLMEKEHFDVCFIYDYREDKLPSFPEYPETIVLAWSAGVIFALSYQEKFNKLTLCGGTGFLRHSKWGIPPKIYDATLLALKKDGEKALLSFYRNLFWREEDFNFFIKNRPRRPLTEIIEELEVLKEKSFSGKPKHARILVTEKDRIIPARNQKNFWNYVGLSFTLKPWEHFPFYRAKTLSSFCLT